MSIEILRHHLLEALNKVVPVASLDRRSQSIILIEPVTGNDKIKISAHNSTINPTLTIAHYATARYDGVFESFCVNGTRLRLFCVGATGDFTLRVGARLSVVSGKNRTTLTLMPVDRFPEVFLPDNLVARISHRLASDLLSVSEIANEESPKATFRGCYLMFDYSHIRTLATDGFRVGHVWAEHECSQSLKVLVPASLLKLMQQSYWTDTLSIFFKKNQIFFVSDWFYVYASILNVGEQEYPAKQLIQSLQDEFSSGITINAKDLIHPLNACAAMISSKRTYIPVKFVIADNQLIIETQPNDAGEMLFTIPVNEQFGIDMAEFWVNSAYIKGAVRLIDQMSNEGMNNVRIYLGTKTDWIFVHRVGLNARFAFAKMNINAWEKAG